MANNGREKAVLRTPDGRRWRVVESWGNQVCLLDIDSSLEHAEWVDASYAHTLSKSRYYPAELMNMVDRIAFDQMTLDGEVWSEATKARRDHYLRRAREALETMLFPTDQMIEAGVKITQNLPVGLRAAQTFFAMVRSGLSAT